MATRRHPENGRHAPPSLTRPTRREGLYRCRQCGGIVTEGTTRGEWVTPVLGMPHDCAAWQLLMQALEHTTHA